MKRLLYSIVLLPCLVQGQGAPGVLRSNTYASGSFSAAGNITVTHNLNTPYPSCRVFDTVGCELGSTGTGPGVGGTCSGISVTARQNNGSNQYAFAFSAPVAGTWTCFSPLSGGTTPTAAQPTDAPGTGTYGSTTSVTLLTSTPGAAICYRLDGVPPAATSLGACDPGSTTYTGAFSLATTTTVTALATATGYNNSSVLSSVYTITGTVATPTASPSGGTYSSTQSVQLLDATAGSTICYTIDGTTPTATTPGTCSHGTTFSSNISISSTTTVKAIGTKTALTNSALLTATYTISAGGFTFTASGTGAANASASGATTSLGNLTTVAGETMWVFIANNTVPASANCGNAGFGGYTWSVNGTDGAGNTDTFTQVGPYTAQNFMCTAMYMATGIHGSATNAYAVHVVATNTTVSYNLIATLEGAGPTATDVNCTGHTNGTSPTSCSSAMTPTASPTFLVAGAADYYIGDTISPASGWTAPAAAAASASGRGQIMMEYQICTTSCTSAITPSVSVTGTILTNLNAANAK